MKEAEEVTKALRERQREIKDTHTSGLSQIDIMNDMIRLLQLKLNLARGIHDIDIVPRPGSGGGAKSSGMSAGGQTFDTGSANVLQL